MNIISALHDRRYFWPMLKAGREAWTWGSWETALKGIFGLPIENPGELKLFRECTGLEQPAGRAREAYIIAGRRSGKSFMSAVIAVYLAAFKNWAKSLSPGERGYIFILAVDKLQARVVRDYVRAILGGSPSFKKLVESETTEETRLRNGVTIAVKTSSFRSVRGYTLLGVILEELAFWRSEESANPDKEVLTAVRPALATIPESLLIGISTPYSRSGVLWEQFRNNFGRPGGPLVWKAESRTMNPTLDRGVIEDELAADPEAGAAEWLAQFRQDIAAFIPADLVEGVCVPGRHELPRVEGVRYTGFCDPSGGRQDSFTLAIAHKDASGRGVLDVLRERRPPFDPESVVEEFCEKLRAYGLQTVTGDKYAGEWVSTAFNRRGVLYESAEMTSSEIFGEVLPLFTSGSVELLDDKRLKSQLAGLERRTRPGGRDQIGHYPGGHDDLATAAAGALLAAGKGSPRTGKVYFAGLVSERAAAEPSRSAGRLGRVFIPGRGEGRDMDLEGSIRASLKRWRQPPDDD